VVAKELKRKLLVVVKGLKILSQEIDKIAKHVEKIDKPQKPKKTRTVELSDFLEIDPAILARVIRGKIYPRDIILGYIIASPDGIDMNTLQRKTGLKPNTIEQIIIKLIYTNFWLVSTQNHDRRNIRFLPNNNFGSLHRYGQEINVTVPVS